VVQDGLGKKSDPITKITTVKRARDEIQETPEFKPKYHQKKKKKKNI
jgi:hypothetical protein